ncbi:MAG TPA: SDR family NAD(P)-dependent oxidoreductase [bacterium]|nr:SDR family NAD(P)-dependent oxidoreductase [bacterium]
MSALDRWRGKVALVTGASSGIGEAIAHALAGAGLKVVVAARRAERLTRVVEAIAQQGGEAVAIPADMGNEASIRALFAAVRERWGGLDVAVNNAGTGAMAAFSEGDAASWRAILDVNVLGVSLCVQEALKAMAGKAEGQIVNLSSIYAHRPQVPNFSYYQASKFAVKALTDTLRAELHAAKSPVRVAMVSPGLTATEFREKATDGKFSYESYFKDFHPLLPEDVAQAVLYILSTPPYVQVHDVLLSPMGQGL